MHTENTAVSCYQQCSEIIRADCRELMSEFGTEQSHEPIRLGRQLGKDRTSFSLYPPYLSPAHTPGIDLSDSVDCPVTLDNVEESLALMRHSSAVGV